MSQVSNSDASAKYAIELQGVCKSFRRTQVLSNLTMRVERGKRFAFLGRNGAGKTTTIRMLLGLLNRDQGEVRVLGLDPVMRKQFNRDLITHLQGEGRTVFYSSHLLYEVEPVADEVAILDGGRLVRQADTETLRRDVKQFVLDRAALAAVRDDMSVLELQRAGEYVAVTVQNASAVRALLDREGIGYRVNDLNLDEIFSAYVAGKVDDDAVARAAVDELAPQR